MNNKDQNHKPIQQKFISIGKIREKHNSFLKKYLEFDNTSDFKDIIDFIKKCRVAAKIIEDPRQRVDLQNILEYWSDKLYENNIVVDTYLEKFDSTFLPELNDNLCPYIGLDAYWKKHREYLFGRDDFIQKLINHLSHQNLLAIKGPFNSGKSSVVYGGLIPKLQEGAVKNSKDWIYYPRILPGSNPIESFKNIIKVFQIQDTQKTRVITFDHFEEIFTLCHDSELRNNFLMEIVNLHTSKKRRNIVILIIQEKYINEIVKYHEFNQYFESSVFNIPILNLQQLRDAIEKPAEIAGLNLEKELVDALLLDLLGDPSSLPLLQFIMLKLWKIREKNKISLCSYNKLTENAYTILECPRKTEDNRAHKILAGSAERLYNQLGDEKQNIARDILKSIFKADGGSNFIEERVTLNNLYKLPKSKETINEVINIFITQNLLRKIISPRDEDNQIEIAHKSLVNDWVRLKKWIEDDRLAQRSLNQLDDDIYRWELSGYSHQYLLSTGKIKSIEEYVRDNKIELNDGQIEFIKESKEKIEEEKATIKKLKFSTIINTLVAQSSHYQERYNENDVSALLARQAYIFNKEYNIFNHSYLGSLMCEIINTSFFGIKLEGDFPKNITSTCCSYNNQLLAIGGSDGIIVIWDIEKNFTQKYIDTEVNYNHTTSLKFIPNKYQQLITGNSSGYVQLWDLSNEMAKPKNLYQHDIKKGDIIGENQPEVWALEISNNGQILASGSRDCTIILWDIENNNLIKKLEKHDDYIWSIAFSPNASLLASASRDESILLWDLDNLEDEPYKLSIKDNIKKYSHEVFSLAFSPDGKTLASGHRDTLQLWNIEDIKQGTHHSIKLSGHEGDIRAVIFHPDQNINILATGSEDQTIRLWDLNSIKSTNLAHQPIVLNSLGSGISSLNFSSDGSKLFSSSWNSIVEVWDFNNPVNIFTLEEAIFSSTYLKNNDYEILISAGEYGQISLVDINKKNYKELIPNAHSGNIRSISTNHDSLIIATGGADRELKLWHIDLPNMKLLDCELLDKHNFGITSTSFSPNGKWLAVGTMDQKIKIWNIYDRTSQTLNENDEESNITEPSQERKLWVFSVDFSSDGNMLSACYGNGLIKLWDFNQETGKLSHEKILNFHSLSVRQVSFSENSKLLASASRDRTICLWDIKNDFKKVVLRGSSAGFSCLSLSPDCKLLAAGAFNGKIWIWDISEYYAAPIILPSHSAGISSLHFSKNGKKLISCSHDKSIRIWNMDSEELSEIICQKVNRNLTKNEWDRFIGLEVPYQDTCLSQEYCQDSDQ